MKEVLKLQKRKSKKRVGRGNGSGLGTYSTRGVKGQGSRSGYSKRPWFEGGQTPLNQRLPKLRGFKNPNKVYNLPLNLSLLELKFKDGDIVNYDSLLKSKLVQKGKDIKVLGQGEITKKITLQGVKCSKIAKEKIEKAGGKVEN